MKYADEGMDCKKILLLFLKKIWVAAIAAVLGAVLGGGAYLFCHVVLDSGREYRAVSKLELNFAPDETGEAYQAYNGYTWNDLMSTDLILDATMSYLPDTYTEEEVIAATAADILSDIRILTVTITASDPDTASEILQATNKSLVEMGEREKEFYSIEVIEETEARLVTADSRLLQAVILGLVGFLAISLAAMAAVYILDDRIYVPGDLKCVTPLPFVGFCFSGTEAGNKEAQKGISRRKLYGGQKLLEGFKKDLELNREYMAKETGNIEALDIGKDNPATEEAYARLRKADGVILVIPYGKIDRASLAYRIGQLALQECKPAGIIIKDADMRFMKWYYNHF